MTTLLIQIRKLGRMNYPHFSSYLVNQLQSIPPLRWISNLFPHYLHHYLSLGPNCFLLKYPWFFNCLPDSVTLHSDPCLDCSKSYPLHSTLLHSDLWSGIHSTLIFSAWETSEAVALTHSKIRAPDDGIQGSSQPGSYFSFHHPLLLLTISHPLLCCIGLIILSKCLPVFLTPRCFLMPLPLSRCSSQQLSLLNSYWAFKI